MNDVMRAKRLLRSKGYVVEEKMVFKGLDESDVVPLNEFLEAHGNDSSWGESLREETEEFSGNQLIQYKVGDLIMPKRYHSKSSGEDVDPHRILLIYSEKEDNNSGIIHYKGFALSSVVEKSNKMGGYPNNIYIQDYATILYRGPIEHKEAYIGVKEIIEFTNRDLSVSGTWKGSVSNKFFRFVNNCYNNYKNGISNRYRYWTSERRYSDGRDNKETA